MINIIINKWLWILPIFLFLFGCDKGKNITPPKPDPPVNEVALSSLRDLINPDEFISDVLWQDNTTHSIQVKTGPRFMIHSNFKEKFFPGAIISTLKLFSIEQQGNNIEMLPVILNFPNDPSINYTPSYENFISLIKNYQSKYLRPFEQASSDNGRPFSTYNDLVLINGYKNEPYANWLKINNKQSKAQKTGIVYQFKTIDYSVNVNLPEMGKLIDRNKYKSQIDADTLGYINQVNIGKRAVITFMCDTSFDGARTIITKLKNGETLTDKEAQILKDGEVGYSLQGYGSAAISSKENGEIIKGIFSLIKNTSVAGEPMEFFVRSIKDFAAYFCEIKIDIIRK